MNIWKKNLLLVFRTTEKEILIIVTVQSILLIPLKVKLKGLEYRRRWWVPLLDKQLALGYWEKLVVERILNISTYSVCNFQSLKSPVKLTSLFSKFFSYITWLDATLDDL